MRLQSHIVTGTLTDINIELHGGVILTLATTEGPTEVPCTKALHDAIGLPIWVGQPVILGVLLNADGRFIDTMTALVNKPTNPVEFLPVVQTAPQAPPAPTVVVQDAPQREHCQRSLQAAGKPYPRTCTTCKLGPCHFRLP